MTRVSVALATYNGERFLRAQLDSLSQQTRLPDELVIGDDGSTDATLDIAREYAAHAEFEVRVQSNAKRLGPEDNFLRTALACRGEVVAFCDQDDVWLPSKIEKCLPYFNGPRVSLVVHAGTVVDEKLVPMKRRFPNIRRLTTLRAPRYPVWPTPAWGFAMLFHRDLLDLGDPSNRPGSDWANARMSHEEWIYFLASALGDAVLVPEELVLYRQHRQSASGGARPDVAGQVKDVIRAGHQMYLGRAAVAADRATHLERIAATRPEIAARLRARAELYTYAAVANERRSLLYKTNLSFIGRLKLFAQFVGGGLYRAGGRGGLGTRALVKDAVVVLLGRFPGAPVSGQTTR